MGQIAYIDERNARLLRLKDCTPVLQIIVLSLCINAIVRASSSIHLVTAMQYSITNNESTHNKTKIEDSIGWTRRYQQMKINVDLVVGFYYFVLCRLSGCAHHSVSWASSIFFICSLQFIRENSAPYCDQLE